LTCPHIYRAACQLKQRITNRKALLPNRGPLQESKVAGTQQQNCTATGTPTCSDTPAPIYTQAFTYDAFGNRKIDAANTSGSSTGINNKVYEPNKRNNRLNGVVYDAAGNVINDSYTFRLNDRTYDAENRMTQANGTTAYYVYDGDGRRVRRIVSGVETWQVYGMDGELLAEYAPGTATPQKEYGYRNGQLLIVAETSPESVKWMVTDHLGTPRIIVDVTGGIVNSSNGISGSLSNVWRHDYLPFGEELTLNVAGGTLRSAGNGYVLDVVRQKFTGYERDSETGLDFAEARYYANLQGRFASPDIVFADQDIATPQSWNLYSYVRNNPLAYIDPSGRELRWSGDIDSARAYTCGVLGVSNCSERVSYNEKTGVVSIDFSGIDLSKNEGAKLLNQLIGSSNVYQLSVSEQIDTRSGTRTLTGLLENLDRNPDERYTKGKPNSELPPAGVDDVVGILPKVISISSTNKLPPPLWLIAFHELAEAYAKIDGGKLYGGTQGAHQEALDREAILRSQRTGLSAFNLGGEPEATFLKHGPKNRAIYLSGPWPYKDVQQQKQKNKRIK